MRTLLVFLFVISVFGIQAAEPSATPMLRIETGMHTAVIRRIATDAAGRVALTCSDDKTARLWSLPDSKADIADFKSILLRTFHIPIDVGEEGKICACALSPDGSLAALAGNTGGWDLLQSIYLFDTASGRLLRRFTKSPYGVGALAFSASGRNLAAGLLNKNGIRVWDVSSGQLIGQDSDYGADCYGLDWLGDRTLVSTCFDSQVRFYQLEEVAKSPTTKPVLLSPSLKTRTKLGKEPFAIRFSPDGHELAVGYMDKSAVSIHATSDLSLRHEPSTQGIDNGKSHLPVVTWSYDGQSLVAGGAWQNNQWLGNIRQWPQAGRGIHQDVPASKGTIHDLRALPTGGFIFAASDPAWGIVSLAQASSGVNGKTQSSITLAKHAMTLGMAPVASYDSVTFEERFQMNADASRITFEYERAAKPASFDLRQRSLMREADLSSTALHRPRVKGLDIQAWNQNEKPTLNGKPLALLQYEQSRCLAIGPNAMFFVIGSDGFLRSFNAEGLPLWEQSVPSVCWGVNLSKDGRVIVAAHGDGTISWHRADTGVELLAFFPHADRKRWVLWTTQYERIEQGKIGIFPSFTEASSNGAVIIQSLDPNSTARAAGLKVGDQLLALDDEPVSALSGVSLVEVSENIQARRPGSTVKIRYRRAGVEGTAIVTIAQSPHPKLVPTGYFYDCSAGGEELIGWHVNRGKDREADFYPASKFRDQFYRPDIIDELIRTWDVDAAVKLANSRRGKVDAQVPKLEDVIATMAPPVVELTVGGPTRTLDIDADATETTLTYRVRGGSTPVSQIRVLVDSRPVDVKAPIPADDKAEINVIVPLPASDCVVALLAGNRHAFSEPAIVNIRRKMAARSTAAATPQKGTLYLLAVGVSKLKNQTTLSDLEKLEYADDDATAFHAAMVGQTKLYRQVESRVLTDEQATAGDILDALDWLKGSTTPADTTLILLAGHGESDVQGRYTFCAHDYDRTRRLRTGVGFEDIKLALGATKGEVVLFLDACSAGSSLGEGSKVDVSGLVNQLSDSDSNIVVFASSDGRTPSLESDNLKQGLFTHCVKEGFGGKADLLRNGRITLSALQTYVDDAVRKLSNNQQIPVINIPKMVPNLMLGLAP